MKKKKQKPKRRAKKQREKASLDETSKALESKRPEFESFLTEMTRWFSDHQQQVDELFSHSDTDRTGSVNAKDFELGLINLNIPCQQQLQLQMLTQQLKTKNNMISYQHLSRQVQKLSHQSLSEDTEINTQVSEDVSRSNTCDHDQLLNPEKENFLRLRVRLIPFEFSAAHPGNFEVVLSTSSRVFSLIRIIRDRVGIQTSRLEVFRSGEPREEAPLPPQSSLEECGFRGGAEETPAEDTVYYDYSLLFTDCPILNCDHYFSSAPDTAAMRASQQT